MVPPMQFLRLLLQRLCVFVGFEFFYIFISYKYIVFDINQFNFSRKVTMLLGGLLNAAYVFAFIQKG